MGVETQKYIRKPLFVDAVRVTAGNFDEIAAWCQGEVQTEEVPGSGTTKKFIKVRVHNPKNPRQTKAFIGDWLLYTERGYKVYTNKAFRAAFDIVEEPKDETPELPAAAPVVEPPSGEVKPLRAASEETVARANEERELAEANPAVAADVVQVDPELLEDTPGPGTAAGPHETPQGEPHEYVEATPRAIADAVGGHEEEIPVDYESAPEEAVEAAKAEFEEPAPEPVSEQPPEVAAAGKRVLSKEEQEQMGPDEVRELVQSGEVVLVQDLAA